mmetsp:Transcript_41403/g.39855  ORF Transcript_41403/g.39855 Transcript_41403/m.39855 type:complete len:88 (-) Transcript_41403:221-484(-)
MPKTARGQNYFSTNLDDRRHSYNIYPNNLLEDFKSADGDNADQLKSEAKEVNKSMQIPSSAEKLPQKLPNFDACKGEKPPRKNFNFA